MSAQGNDDHRTVFIEVRVLVEFVFIGYGSNFKVGAATAGNLWTWAAIT